MCRDSTFGLFAAMDAVERECGQCGAQGPQQSGAAAPNKLLLMCCSNGAFVSMHHRLLDVRNGRPGKQVQLAENEIRLLCLTAKEIFMSQPNLLELEAPIKICGACMGGRWWPPSCLSVTASGGVIPERGRCVRAPWGLQETSTASTQTCSGSLSTVASRQKPTTCSSGTMWTAGSRAWKQSACCWRSR